MKRHLIWRTTAIAAVAMTAVPARSELVVGPARPAPVAAGASREAAAPPIAPVNPRGDRLALAGGEWLRGQLVGADPAAGTIAWRHPAARGEIVFAIAAVAEIQLGARSGAAARAASGALRLTNGDELRGNVTSVDSERVVVEATPAGTLSVRRAMVAEIIPGGGVAEVLYEGPNSLEEWSSRGDRARQWELRDGALSPVLPAPLGRVIDKMGDAVQIDFTVEWRKQPAYFSFWMFHEKPEEPHGDAYVLNCVAGQRMDLNRMRSSGGSQNLGSVEMGEVMGGPVNAGSMHMTIFANRQQGEVAVMVNGKLLRQWKDPREFKGTGRAITFMSQGVRDLRISGICVARWTGPLPQSRGASGKKNSDTVVLLNGDLISGELTRMANGRFHVKTHFADAEMEIPAERVVQVMLSAASAVRARRRSGDVRLRLVGGGSVTLDLARLDGTAVAGASENWGESEWPMAAVRRIEFNLYSSKDRRDDE